MITQHIREHLVKAMALGMFAYHIWVVLAGPPEVLLFRSTHLLLGLLLIFLWYSPLPARAQTNSGTDLAINTACLVAAAAPLLYLFFRYDYVTSRFPYFDDLTIWDIGMGVSLIVMVLEAARRTSGTALPLTVMAVFLYCLLRVDIHPLEIIDHLYLTTAGIFGIPINVAATFILLFVVFGSLSEKTGTGRLFTDFALALAGGSAGGPAKVAVMTSAMLGTISGSSTANAVTTGAFSIPLMKKVGYRPAFAGAVEAVASTGGQIMPPIMGAAAFVMAEFMAVSYLTVLAAALVPAVLYFLAVFLAVHFEAKKTGLKGLPTADLPRMRKVVRQRGHQIIPLAIIVAVLMSGFSPALAAASGIAAVVPVAMARQSTRAQLSVGMIVDGIVMGIKNSLQVTAACACSGIVIGLVELSGLGLDFTGFIIDLSTDSLLGALILTALAGIILGMGLPTTPAYIVQAALLIPALIAMGLEVIAAHFFAFYFAILSSVTPPVAITLYAANGLSGAGLWQGGAAAIKLAATGYIVPFMFAFGPALLMQGTFAEISLAFASALLGVVCIAAGLHGYFLGPLTPVRRGALVLAALALIHTEATTDYLGLAVFLTVLATQYYQQTSGGTPDETY